MFNKILAYSLTGIIYLTFFSVIAPRAIQKTQIKSVNRSRRVIFFDLNGVLFDVNRKLAQKHAQFTPNTALQYLFVDHKNPFKFKQRFLELLEKVPCNDITLHDSPEKIMAQGDPMPTIMIAHHAGKISSPEALERIRVTFNELRARNTIVSERELQLLLRTAQIAFDSELRFSLSTIDTEMITLIKKLKRQGYCICAISNQDRAFLAMLKKRAPQIYQLFTHIIISADIGVCKPHKTIFDHACHTAGVLAHDAILIDDQEENVIGARAAGMGGVHHTTTPHTVEKLQKLGVCA